MTDLQLKTLCEYLVEFQSIHGPIHNLECGLRRYSLGVTIIGSLGVKITTDNMRETVCIYSDGILGHEGWVELPYSLELK